MQTLVDRALARGLVARVFGHPAAPLPDRDALVAAATALSASVLSWMAPGIALPVAAIGVLACASIGFGWLSPWPKSGAWTVIIGRPGPHVRRIRVLALDARAPRAWLTPLAGAATVLAGLVPSWPGAMLVCLAVFLAAAFDRVRAREIPIEQAESWVVARNPSADTLVLVSTAGSGPAEGVRAVVDWFALDGRNVFVEIDEERPGFTLRRLNTFGIGRVEPEGGADVVVGDRSRG